MSHISGLNKDVIHFNFVEPIKTNKFDYFTCLCLWITVYELYSLNFLQNILHHIEFLRVLE